MAARWKVVRTDAELEMPRTDARLREMGAQLVLLPESTAEDALERELADADLLLMCYARIDAGTLAAATRLKATLNTGSTRRIQ